MIVYLPHSPSHLLNSLTSSSPQLITSPFHLPLSLSPLELPNLFISPINYTLNFLFKSCTEIFFLVSLWSLRFYCCLNLKDTFFPLWFFIGFTGFHAFIYFFIWFFCFAQFFFSLAFGVLCSVGFMHGFFFFFFFFFSRSN